MDFWLQNLTPEEAVIVPTRSLATLLSEQLADYHLSQNRAVWEKPNILLWSDYVQNLWHLNQARIAAVTGAHALITPQQSLLLWTQVIERSRKQDQELTLLNVQQTAKAVQRSWRLMNDWLVNAQAIQKDPAADTSQFINWVNEYQQLLRKRGLLDESLLIQALINSDCEFSFKKVTWYCYDLITATQNSLNNVAKSKGVEVERLDSQPTKNQKKTHRSFEDVHSELTQTLLSARLRFEQDPDLSINIVVPDLQHRRAEVEEIAKQVFYPSLSPLELQRNSNVYRFSLGEPLQKWSAIELSNLLIKLIKNRIKLSEFSFIVRNRFLRFSKQNCQQWREFDQWLRKKRFSAISVNELVSLYQQHLDEKQDQSEPVLLTKLQEIVTNLDQIKQDLAETKQRSGYAALSFSQWTEYFANWLNVWGWTTSIAGEEMSSVQYQLQQRWNSLLKEYSSLDAVQGQAGLQRAVEVLQQMTFDAVFQPQAVASPILISGVYEAIGQKADICFLTGMDQSYPTPAKNDAFIPGRLLVKSGYPEAAAVSSYQQAKKVTHSLTSQAQELFVSYARQSPIDGEVINRASTLFQGNIFNNIKPPAKAPNRVTKTIYQDTSGPAWPQGEDVSGGVKVFENQSNCAFKAFVSHQLGFIPNEEHEFGLDPLDRGSVVHKLLENIWEELQTQENLLSLTEAELALLVEKNINLTIEFYKGEINEEKFKLLKLEKLRLKRLLNSWLDVEKNRPQGFTVIEKEEKRYSEFSGIKFRYTIDRLDVLDDGRSVLVDYKTGYVAKKDWQGDRIKSPQLPLYALALNKVKKKDVSGISFANIKQSDSKYEFLSESGIFKTSSHIDKKNEESWLASSARWTEVFEQLATDFLTGDAKVNPIDEKTCEYCDLSSICRISQLREQSQDCRDPKESA
ncbi:MAG: PD-(D/E)XK nuclease family protein [Acidiferrobacterales bacterium]|nr:PD-(D/E)XK nuclease family protein [Acidiferrobacterales bacterium]